MAVKTEKKVDGISILSKAHTATVNARAYFGEYVHWVADSNTRVETVITHLMEVMEFSSSNPDAFLFSGRFHGWRITSLS
jgi:hypothetical protein